MTIKVGDIIRIKGSIVPRFKVIHVFSDLAFKCKDESGVVYDCMYSSECQIEEHIKIINEPFNQNIFSKIIDNYDER